ncbi:MULTISPECIES: MFS transporter [unclassified Ensifer]|uniref:MFS transporter n=1 Tax=unclassified Ensifer TaxID=2633371 RepID=UPI000812FDDB|nr:MULTISPECIES: MFS transporter [unclassified Ensifer]OCO98660.1 MFS transporter [Ensifer sp. LC14]OCP13140.1 MFS transporter [Ensifer sp. LC13]OCP13744.1 MFS transporter [Ensifer sp. LC11]OCP28120.1 MFS transporter [Ensifer sp. LC499]
MLEKTPAPRQDTGWRALLSGENAVHSLILSGGVALHALNIYVVTTIMPSIVREIGGLEYYAWSTTVFVAASILGAALSARMLGAAGAGGAYAIGAIVFGLGTLFCAIAPSMAVLLAGRAIQGFGGGLLYALAYGVIRQVFRPELWTRAIGLISATWGTATLIGPAVGGMFAEFAHWRAAFWSLLPLTALLAMLAFSTLPRQAAAEEGRTPLPLLQLLLLVGIVLALSVASTLTTTIEQLSCVGIAVLLFPGLLLVERRAAGKLLPSGSFTLASPLAALYATITLLMVGLQPEIYVPYLLQELHELSPLVAGYIAALMSIGWTAGSMTSAHWHGERAKRTIFAGPAFGFVGLALIAVFMPMAATEFSVIAAPLCIGIMAVGFGMGFAWPHIVTAVYEFAPDGEAEKAASSITTVQLFAAALGAALAGLTANLSGIETPSEEGVAMAATWLFWLFALMPALAVLTARRVWRSRRTTA